MIIKIMLKYLTLLNVGIEEMYTTIFDTLPTTERLGMYDCDEGPASEGSIPDAYLFDSA